MKSHEEYGLTYLTWAPGKKKTMETKAEKAENYFLSKRQIKERIYVW